MPSRIPLDPPDDDSCEDTAAYLDPDDLRPLMFDGEVQCWHCQEIDLVSEMRYDPARDHYCCLNCLDYLNQKGFDARP